MKTIYFFLLILFYLPFGGVAQSLIEEPFNYTPDANNNLADQSEGTWIADGTGSPLLVTESSLTYPGLPASTGNKISFASTATSHYRTFQGQASGTLYLSFIFRINSLPSSEEGDYFIHLGNSKAIVIPIYIRASSVTGKFNVGMAKRNNLDPDWVNKEMDANTAYFLVASISFVDGAKNDICNLWINPAAGDESTPDISFSNGADVNKFQNIVRLILNQSGEANQGLNMDMDELRISTEWLKLSEATAPGTPENLTATADGPTTINLSWTDKSDNETGFAIERSPDGVTFIPIDTVAANTTSYADTELTALTNYFYRISAMGPAGNSEYSNTANATTAPASENTLFTEPFDYPADPSNDLSQQSEGVWEIDGSGDSILVTEGSLTYPGLLPSSGNKIFFKSSGVENSRTFQGQASGTLYVSFIFKVNSLSPSETGDYFIHIGNKVAIVNPIYLRTSGTAGKFNIGMAKRNNLKPDWIDKDLDVNTAYYLVASITAVDGDKNDICNLWINPAAGDESAPDISFSNGADVNKFQNISRIIINRSGDENPGLQMDMDELRVSAEWLKLTEATAPGTPENLTATVDGSTMINLSWTDKSDNETGFAIERSPDGVTFIPLDTTAANTTTYTDTDLTALTNYFYRVSAIGTTGNSEYSDIAHATTAPVSISTLITEPFDYPADPSNDLSQQSEGIWEIDGSGDSILVTEGSLTYPGLLPSSGNKISFKSSGVENSRTFQGQTSGTLYVSFILKVNSLPTSETGDYFIHIGNKVGIVNPIYLKASGTAGKFNIGMAKRNNLTPDWIDKDLDVNTAYFLVASITAVDGNKNDMCNLWINPAAGDEPTPDISFSNGADVNNFQNIGRIIINRSGDENPGLEMDMDELRVSTEWLSLAKVIIPSAPTMLTAESNSSTVISLNWTDNADDETGFEIERSSDGIIFTSIEILDANTTAYTDNNLTASTQYYYRVRALGPGGNSGYSNIADATTDAVIPVTPGTLTATATSSTTINLTWDDNSDNETGFEIERSSDGTTFALLVTLAANTVEYTDTDLTPSTTYYYHIRAIGVKGNSDFSDISNATTEAAIPIGPGGLTASSVSSSEISLTWTDNSDNETWFELERSLNGTAFVLATTIPNNAIAYTDGDLKGSTQYYYRIRATGVAGSSDYSNIANTTTEVQPQEKLIANNLLTPNGDGRNDTWIIKHIEQYPNNEVSVFDRAGHLVFHKKGYTNNWNGNYKGSPLPSGAYIYVITPDKSIAPVKGILNIISNRR